MYFKLTFLVNGIELEYDSLIEFLNSLGLLTKARTNFFFNSRVGDVLTCGNYFKVERID